MSHVHINDKVELEETIAAIQNGEFYYTGIVIHDPYQAPITPKNTIAELQKFDSKTWEQESFSTSELIAPIAPVFKDDDLKVLLAAIEQSKWCQQNLEELNISSTQFTKIPDLKCDNLKKFDCHSMFVVESGKIQCPNLEVLSAYDSNARTPPNVMELPNLKTLEICQNNPLSLLGIYALILMQQKQGFKIDEQTEATNATLVQKFIANIIANGATLNEERKTGSYTTVDSITNSKLEMQDLPWLNDIDVQDFIENFKVTEGLIELHIASLTNLIIKTYYIEQGFFHNPDAQPPRNFKINHLLARLRFEYQKALYTSARHMKIWLKETKDPIDKINKNTLDNIIRFNPSESLKHIAQHDKFFIAILDKELNILKEIFIAANKPQDAKVIKNFQQKNIKRNEVSFRLIDRILLQCKDKLVLSPKTETKKERKSATKLLPSFKFWKKSAEKSESTKKTPPPQRKEKPISKTKTGPR